MKRQLFLISAVMLLCGACGDKSADKSSDDPSQSGQSATEHYWATAQVPMGLQVSTGNPSFYLGGKKYYETGVNCYDLFVSGINTSGASCSFSTATPYRILDTLSTHKVGVVRFSCGLFYATEMKAYTENKANYLAMLDSVAKRAETLHIGLIPSVVWNSAAIPEYCGEKLRSWGKADSKTIAYMKAYVKDVVTTLAKYKSIYAWEFGNEINLQADLPNWQDVFHTSNAESHLLGADVAYALSAFTAVVKANDAAGRAILTGHANLRDSQYNQYKYNTWTVDKSSEYKVITKILTPDGMQVSEHIYDQYRTFADLGKVNLTKRLQVARETAEALGKAYYVGEFGATSDDGYAAYYDAMLNTGIQLSMVWNFSINGQIEYSFTAQSARGILLFKLINEYNQKLHEKYD